MKYLSYLLNATICLDFVNPFSEKGREGHVSLGARFCLLNEGDVESDELMKNSEKKPVTLREVADHAGVSAATVSLVLNRKGDISETTRDKVHAAVSALKYKPRASRMKSEALPTVRFLKLAKHGQTVNRDHNHFISDYIDGMSAEAVSCGYILEVVSHEGDDIEVVRSFLEDRATQGAIVLATELSGDDIQKLNDCRIPVVFIDAYYPFLEANFVDMDNDQMIFSAVSALLRAGAQRIGFVGSHSDVVNFRLRSDAFRSACDALGLSLSEDQILAVPATREAAYVSAKDQLDRLDFLAQAYVCANDIVALGLMRALRERSVSIPEDVAVIGFDNLPMSSMISPSLSTIDVPKRQIGALAVRTLHELVAGSKPAAPTKILVSGRLIFRGSTNVSTGS